MKLSKLKKDDQFRLWGSLWRFDSVLRDGRAFRVVLIEKDDPYEGEAAQFVGDHDVELVCIPHPEPMPYRLTIWRAGHYELARFRSFDLALECYRHLRDETKQLTNVELACDGKSGLTDEQHEALLEAT